MDQEKIGNYIRQLRKEHNLSQQAFANKLGVTFQAVSKWENGKNLPDMSVLNEISKQFNVEIDEIIKGEKKKPKKSIKYQIIISIILIICLGIGILLISKNNKISAYQFNEIKSSNTDFNISGSVVKTDDRTSLIINSVDYTGEEDEIAYKELSCNLYEEKNNTKTKISSCDKEENKTLREFLENLKIKMDHHSEKCTMFVQSEIIIEIVALDDKNREITYKIPIKMNQEDCK